MEKVKLIPEDLQSKFKSKEDLYKLLSVDLRYYLPPIEKCPMHFLRAVLSGEKKIFRKEKLIEISIPRYQELSVFKIWNLIQEVPELLQYFPKYRENQLPDRKHMFGILATLRFDEINGLVKNARKNRSTNVYDNEDKLIHITKAFYDEIKAVVSQKLSKGKASQLLKRSAKLTFNRKAAKTYLLCIESLKKDDEEEKGADDMS